MKQTTKCFQEIFFVNSVKNSLETEKQNKFKHRSDLFTQYISKISIWDRKWQWFLEHFTTEYTQGLPRVCHAQVKLLVRISKINILKLFNINQLAITEYGLKLKSWRKQPPPKILFYVLGVVSRKFLVVFHLKFHLMYFDW